MGCTVSKPIPSPTQLNIVVRVDTNEVDHDHMRSHVTLNQDHCTCHGATKLTSTVPNACKYMLGKINVSFVFVNGVATNATYQFTQTNYDYIVGRFVAACTAIQNSGMNCVFLPKYYQIAVNTSSALSPTSQDSADSLWLTPAASTLIQECNIVYGSTYEDQLASYNDKQLVAARLEDSSITHGITILVTKYPPMNSTPKQYVCSTYCGVGYIYYDSGTTADYKWEACFQNLLCQCFGAASEANSQQCVATAGTNNVPNTNCTEQTLLCVMRGIPLYTPICMYTRGQIGWLWPSIESAEITNINPVDGPCTFTSKINSTSRLFIFYKTSDANMYYSVADAGTVTFPAGSAKSTGVKIRGWASATKYLNKLYLFYNSSSDNKLCYTVSSLTSTTLSFNGEQTISGRTSTKPPSVAIFAGKIYVFWRGADNSNVYYVSYSTAGGFSSSSSIVCSGGSPIQTNISPTVILWNSYLVLFYQANDSAGTIKYVYSRSPYAYGGNIDWGDSFSVKYTNMSNVVITCTTKNVIGACCTKSLEDDDTLCLFYRYSNDSIAFTSTSIVCFDNHGSALKWSLLRNEGQYTNNARPIAVTGSDYPCDNKTNLTYIFCPNDGPDTLRYGALTNLPQ